MNENELKTFKQELADKAKKVIDDQLEKEANRKAKILQARMEASNRYDEAEARMEQMKKDGVDYIKVLLDKGWFTQTVTNDDKWYVRTYDSKSRVLLSENSEGTYVEYSYNDENRTAVVKHHRNIKEDKYNIDIKNK